MKKPSDSVITIILAVLLMLIGYSVYTALPFVVAISMNLVTLVIMLVMFVLLVWGTFRSVDEIRSEEFEDYSPWKQLLIYAPIAIWYLLCLWIIF